MEHELRRFVIWTYYPEDAYGNKPGWNISGSTDDWNSAVESWLRAKTEQGAGPSYIMEVCKLRIEREPVAEAAIEAVFGKTISPF